MRIREYLDSDLAALQQMHASQGFAYGFPDLRDPLFISKLILQDDAGRPTMAALARLTCEMYLLVDRGAGQPANPQQRYAQLLALHDAGERDLVNKGLQDAHAWLPPQIAKRFGRRLTKWGWVRDDAWTPYCKKFDRT